MLNTESILWVDVVLQLQCMVVSGGQVIIGAVVSSTIMTCEQLSLFPQVSVAVQVRVIVIGHKVGDVTALNAGVSVPSQLSEAVTLAGAGTSPIHCTVVSLGHPLNTGLVVSLTKMI